MSDDGPTDVNEQVVSEWVEETTPFERVREIVQRTYEPQPVSTLADRARTSDTTARKHVRSLVANGYVEESPDPDSAGSRYKRSDESLLFEQANRIRVETDDATLLDRVAEMKATVRSYREEFDADTPEEAVLSDAEIDRETLQDWQTTRRNLSFATVALALSSAEDDLQASTVL